MGMLNSVTAMIDRYGNSVTVKNGGINVKTAKQCLEYGADALVSGNSIFAAEDPAVALKDLKNIQL